MYILDNLFSKIITVYDYIDNDLDFRSGIGNVLTFFLALHGDFFFFFVTLKKVTKSSKYSTTIEKAVTLILYMACDLITVSESYWRIVKFSVTVTVTNLKLWIDRILFLNMIPQNSYQYRPSVILNEFFTFFSVK